MKLLPVALLVHELILPRAHSARSTSSAPHESLEPRVIRGRPARPGQFPFIASLRNYHGEHFCGGSIISPQWILTAAHCLGRVSKDTTAEVGTIRRCSGTIYQIEKWLGHHLFGGQKKSRYLKNDVALIKVKGMMKFNKSVQPIRLGHPEPGDLCDVVGWGRTENSTYPDDLLFADVRTLRLRACREFKEYRKKVGHGQVCSLDPDGKSPCTGDSGGPLVLQDVLVGIVSYGHTPCGNYFPEVYTSPLAYSCWIARNTGIPILELIADF